MRVHGLVRPSNIFAGARFSRNGTHLRNHAQAENEMCRLTGRHVFHSIGGAWPVNTPGRSRLFDSFMPHVPILKENLLVVGMWAPLNACKTTRILYRFGWQVRHLVRRIAF